MTEGKPCLSLLYERERDIIKNLQTDEEIPFSHFARIFSKIALLRREYLERAGPEAAECIT